MKWQAMRASAELTPANARGNHFFSSPLKQPVTARQRSLQVFG
jgi:hypothetical protein